MQITEVKISLVSLLALVNEDNEILIGLRPRNANFSNYWEFPGGKVEKNEHPEQTIIRETKEEIDIDLTKSCLAPLSFTTHQIEKVNLVLLLYVAITFLIDDAV